MIISEQVAFVTGANRGFGRHLTLELLSRGAKVYGGARNPETINIPGVIPVKLDITNTQELEAAVILAKDVTLLINNAGSATGATLLDDEVEKIHLEFDTHFFGTLSMVRAFAPIIEKNGGGSILNVLSALSWFSSGTVGAYSAAKAAEWALTNDLRLNLYPHNIRVSGLHVGFMDTDMTTSLEVPKASPADIAKIAINGIESGSFEIIADDNSRMIQGGLAGGVPALYPHLS
ncbi:short-chain dehydrogenase [Paenibacillus odorifer]|uniref:SDR family oxidoreductase n=1 Tax=Paenibacillus TaxID=44249 RepID=UPI00096BF79A|nr:MULTISPECIES: SDR family oxidoreductase [Paenibacillus]MDH6430546.1 NAD(P)-dependent dehydrogenase (short-subunit alcohol dehydrogenase family) [Paenibacillus sp. PastH-4]MDH6443707.1 NAD(P)-dependent dehydrogenase (short-subunit alcohol dehydrogenase family) [Paenibacillus sp. PastF-4]MDH6527616.1 NAD(P)-dependent dehydrogenase (short-subunit alcohol dehydrogenase family) [Paenibacillus sp. PastH-3]OMD62281.1 short-chain dehydrogenase [Paenibacillus odorifer]